MKRWSKKLGFRRPNDKVEWAIWVGAGFILLAIINSLLFVKKPIQLSLNAFTAISTTSVLKDIGNGIIASAILIGGLNQIKSDKKKLKGYFLTIGGIMMFLYLIGTSAASSVMLANIQSEVIKSSNILINKEIQNLKKKDLSVADKSRFTKIIAQEKYFRDGFKTEYTDRQGNTLMYQPTVEDVQNRDQFLIGHQLISVLRYEMVFWIIVLVINITSFILLSRMKARMD